MPRNQKEETFTHSHTWGPSFDLSTKACSCGAVLISEAELNRRADEWRAYFDWVKTTESYLRFQKVKEAFKNHNISLVKELAKEADEALGKDEYENNRPNFPDPETWNKYVVN